MCGAVGCGINWVPWSIFNNFSQQVAHLSDSRGFVQGVAWNRRYGNIFDIIIDITDIIDVIDRIFINTINNIYIIVYF